MLSDKDKNEIASKAIEKEKTAVKASEGHFDNLYQCTEVQLSLLAVNLSVFLVSKRMFVLGIKF